MDMYEAYFHLADEEFNPKDDAWIEREKKKANPFELATEINIQEDILPF